MEINDNVMIKLSLKKIKKQADETADEKIKFKCNLCNWFEQKNNYFFNWSWGGRISLPKK